jgi:hypothetical protein
LWSSIPFAAHAAMANTHAIATLSGKFNGATKATSTAVFYI